MATACQVTSNYCANLLKIDAASWYINAEFKVVLEPIFHQTYSALQVVFNPSIAAAVTSDTPPPIEFFLGLPAPQACTWAVYVLVFLDNDVNHLLYIGSGTDAISGVKARTNNYANKTHPMLPRFVRQAFDRGCKLLHIGMLCWI
jgi:hypothetical protein